MLQRERNGPSNVEEEEQEEDGQCSVDKLIDKMANLKAKLDQVSKCHGDIKIKGFFPNSFKSISLTTIFLKNP